MRFALLALLVLASGCATHPALKATGIALGAVLVAGAAQQHGGASPAAISEQRVPGNPCAVDPARCK